MYPDRSYLVENTHFAGIHGGGGNRTRDPRNPYWRDFQWKYFQLAWASQLETDFVTELRDRIYTERDALGRGQETNLYAVIQGEEAVKLGIAANVKSRAAGMQSNNPRKLKLFSAIPATDTLEAFFHDALSQHRIRGEWFRWTDQVLAVLELMVFVWEMSVDLALAGDEPDSSFSISLLGDEARREYEALGLFVTAGQAA